MGVCNIDNTKLGDVAFPVEAEYGSDFQEYCYSDGSPVPQGEMVGVEIYMDGEWKLFLLLGIYFKS